MTDVHPSGGATPGTSQGAPDDEASAVAGMAPATPATDATDAPPAPQAPREPGAGRRSFLRGLVGGIAGGVVAGGAAGVAGGYAGRAGQPADPSVAASAAAANGTLPAVPFHGQYQAGILPVPQRHSIVASFDVTAASKAELTELFQTITDRARFLTAGGTPGLAGVSGPPSDSGILGPVVPPDGLTMTLGVGSPLFDDRFGLAALKPAHLGPMAPFPNDDLDPAQTGGDLVLQFSAGSPDTVAHALRDVARYTRGGMQVNWRMNGFNSPPRPAGTVSRNFLGFMDGVANPDVTSATEMNKLVWVQPGAKGEPAWTAGGSYFVVRLIRMLVEFWDRVDLLEQENMFGRRRDSGYLLDEMGISTPPDYSKDPTGEVIPLTAHIRVANPRTAATASSQILRRSYSYDRGIDDVGNLDVGLLFTCFQQDVTRQFAAVQTRLIDEPLVDYISPFGGGYFLALPGVTGSSDYFGRSLLT
ncbi:MAG TPA: Dyp-type peroxidase [Trebonia sp.]|jgi:deferrochelatase/peroxidase EfeB|nr:Dyp-type peroxidase [Trebonia sp.]